MGPKTMLLATILNRNVSRAWCSEEQMQQRVVLFVSLFFFLVLFIGFVWFVCFRFIFKSEVPWKFSGRSHLLA